MAYEKTRDTETTYESSYIRKDWVHPTHRPKRSIAPKPAQPLLRYRRPAIYLYCFYAFLLTLPWILTCLLAVGSPDYYQQAHGLSIAGSRLYRSTLVAIRVLNAIVAIATIPLISAILAQAAVVYTQRQSHNQKFNLAQTFVLADRGWGDIVALWHVQYGDRKAARSRFLVLGAVLIFFGAALIPIQQIVVGYQQSSVMTCLDNPHAPCLSSEHLILESPSAIAYDPEPADLAQMDLSTVVQQAANSIGSVSERDTDAFLWRDTVSTDDVLHRIQPVITKTFGYYFPTEDLDTAGYGQQLFVAAIPQDTTTGVLRQHAVRFNSTVTCDKGPSSAFPQICPGELPFEAAYSDAQTVEIRVCVPGNYGKHPWTLSRNAQLVEEDLYLSLSGSQTVLDDFSIHCRAKTTRAYYELGNYRNKYTYGPMLAEWPDRKYMETESNDILGGIDPKPPTESDSNPSVDITGGSDLAPPGPLMIAALAIFGNSTAFSVAFSANSSDSPPVSVQMCLIGDIPFGGFDALFPYGKPTCGNIQYDFDAGESESDSNYDLMNFLINWVSVFYDPANAQSALGFAMYWASRHLLTSTAIATGAPLGNARPIFDRPGLVIERPSMTIAGIVVMSAFILIELVALAYVVYYTQKLPTWTCTLDATAMARIGASMKSTDLLPLRSGDERLTKEVAETDGLVGVLKQKPEGDGQFAVDVNGDHKESDAATSFDVESAIGKTDVTLGLGALGLITRKLATKIVKRGKEYREVPSNH